MATQLGQRPSRVERQRIDSRNERFDGDRRRISESHKQINLDNINLSQKDVRTFFKRAGDILNGDFERRPQPNFPYIAAYLATVKDVLDFAEITGVALFITIPVSILASAALIYWAWGKTSFRAWKEKIVRWLIISVFIELCPYVNFIPATLILVLIIHYNETKLIRLINLTLDYLEKGGVLD